MALTKFSNYNHYFSALEKIRAKQYCYIRVIVWSEDLVHG